MTDTGPFNAEPAVVAVPVSPWWLRWARILRSRSAYPRGWAMRMLRSRWGSWADQGLALCAFGLAAAPDFGVAWLTGWSGIALLAVVFLGSRAFTAMVQGSALDGYREHFLRCSGIISIMAGERREGGGPGILRDPNRIIDILLRAARGLAFQAFRVPERERIAANLLLPVFEEQKLVGLRASRRDEYYHDRPSRLIPLDAPGAGRAFSTGEYAVIENVDDWNYARLRDRPYKSIAAFPITVGDLAESSTVIAVLTIDSTHPYTFSDKAVRKRLYPFVSPVAQLIGMALAIHEEKEANHG